MGGPETVHDAGRKGTPMLNATRKQPSPEDTGRAERLREVLADAIEVNKLVPVVVEGRRDVMALRQLGFAGEILVLHRGKGLYDFCEEVAERFGKVILLMDWDEKGEDLHRSLARHLGGHWEDFEIFRSMLRILCQKDIKDVEGIPKLLNRLEGCEYPR